MKEVDNRIVDSLEEKNNTICEMSSFCNSLAPVLQGLPIKKARPAKLKISQLLFEIEFGVEYKDIFVFTFAPTAFVIAITFLTLAIIGL